MAVSLFATKVVTTGIVMNVIKTIVVSMYQLLPNGLNLFFGIIQKCFANTVNVYSHRMAILTWVCFFNIYT